MKRRIPLRVAAAASPNSVPWQGLQRCFMQPDTVWNKEGRKTLDWTWEANVTAKTPSATSRRCIPVALPQHYQYPHTHSYKPARVPQQPSFSSTPHSLSDITPAVQIPWQAGRHRQRLAARCRPLRAAAQRCCPGSTWLEIKAHPLRFTYPAWRPHLVGTQGTGPRRARSPCGAGSGLWWHPEVPATPRWAPEGKSRQLLACNPAESIIFQAEY